MSQRERIDRLYTAIELGLTANETDPSPQLSPSEQAKAKRGIDSELNVVTALSQVPVVASIEKSGPSAPKNRKGDFTVHLDPDKSTTPVYVEVKSSNVGIREFRRFLRKRYHIRPKKLNTWLKDNNLIILNGQRRYADIATKFIEQLDAINAHHAQKAE